jgi:cytochrome c
MKQSICLISMLSLAAAAVVMARDAQAADVPQIDLAEWTPPSIGSVGDDPFGKLVKYGYGLFTDTPNQIGPAAADPAKRFSVNGLTCQSCHLKAGTQPYSVPMTGVWGQFPQYRPREAQVDTLEDRINGCLERSMNGHALPLDAIASAFVRHNMPYGTTFDTPMLSDAEAYDVAAYVNSLERPTKPNLDKDFPNKLLKPVDAPYGPYADDFPSEQHKYGPFDPIRAKVRELAAARK